MSKHCECAGSCPNPGDPCHCVCHLSKYELLQEENKHLTLEVERLRGALANIKHEVGVPQPGYPQPVANAYEIAKSALSHEPGKA